MNAIEAMEKELKFIKENHSNFEPYIRDDFKELVIGIQYSDEKFHFIVSHPTTALEFAEELIKIAHCFHKTRKNFKELEYKNIITEKDMLL